MKRNKIYGSMCLATCNLSENEMVCLLFSNLSSSGGFWSLLTGAISLLIGPYPGERKEGGAEWAIE